MENNNKSFCSNDFEVNFIIERARQQWFCGDWDSLRRFNLDYSIHNNNNYAELYLLIGAAFLQVGDSKRGSDHIKQALNLGCSRAYVLRTLFAGSLYNVARVRLIYGNSSKAQEYFKKAVFYKNYLYHAGLKNKNQSPDKLNIFNIDNLGSAWAGNTINTVIFRHHGMITCDNYQFAAFYVDETTIRFIKRELFKKNIETFDLLGQFNLKDAHNSISIGADRQGYLHISYGLHASQLRYKRSLQPFDISAWTDDLPMTGFYEEKVTYPTFIMPHHGYPLTFLYRDGVHDRGTARMKTYDEVKKTWVNHPKAIISGAEQRPWTSNPYWNNPAIGSDGSLHLSFVWRTHLLDEFKLINNINICYACSYDNGLTWQTSKNKFYKLPITQVNVETIYPVSPGENLINQASMTLDSKNYPHIAYYSNDDEGIPQYFHLWFDGKKWRNDTISNRKNKFNLKGDGTLQIPISRPEILIDKSDNVFVLVRADYMGNHMSSIFLEAPDYVFNKNNENILYKEELGYAEPIVDRVLWKQTNILSMQIQKNNQPNNEKTPLEIYNDIKIIDFKIS